MEKSNIYTLKKSIENRSSRLIKYHYKKKFDFHFFIHGLYYECYFLFYSMHYYDELCNNIYANIIMKSFMSYLIGFATSHKLS